MHVSEPKTAKGKRSLALDPATAAALREHRAHQAEERLIVGPGWQDSGLVFTWGDGRPLHPERFSRWFERLAREAGLPKRVLGVGLTAGCSGFGKVPGVSGSSLTLQEGQDSSGVPGVAVGDRPPVSDAERSTQRRA